MYKNIGSKKSKSNVSTKGENEHDKDSRKKAETVFQMYFFKKWGNLTSSRKNRRHKTLILKILSTKQWRNALNNFENICKCKHFC